MKGHREGGRDGEREGGWESGRGMQREDGECQLTLTWNQTSTCLVLTPNASATDTFCFAVRRGYCSKMVSSMRTWVQESNENTDTGVREA